MLLRAIIRLQIKLLDCRLGRLDFVEAFCVMRLFLPLDKINLILHVYRDILLNCLIGRTHFGTPQCPS